MNISVDGGALNPKNNQRFGTAVFSDNLVKALQLYDNKNKYRIYTFKNLKPKFLWMKGRVSIEEIMHKNDIFLALNQAFPLYTSGRIISFCHGLSYYFYPQYYSMKNIHRLNKQLKEMINRSNIIVVSSQKVKEELLTIEKKIAKKIVVLPFGVPFDMNNVKKFKSSKVKKYFLYVGMDHPIKNIEFIKEVFKKFQKVKKFEGYKLMVVTNNCSRKKLGNLYKNASALLTASHYESFNFPVLEALSVGCPVIGLNSAIIPELKPFVNLANNQEEFISLMIDNIKSKSKPILIKHLTELFNWQSYVENLVKLY